MLIRRMFIMLAIITYLVKDLQFHSSRTS